MLRSLPPLGNEVRTETATSLPAEPHTRGPRPPLSHPTMPPHAAPSVATAPSPRALPQALGGASPLWAVLAFTFLNSISGGVVTTGFAFLAKSAYGFTTTQNYALGLLQGITYIIGALAVGPVLRRLVARWDWLTGRAVLIILMFVLAAGCFLPLAVAALGATDTPPIQGLPEGTTAPASGAWTLWTLIALYSLLTGVLWPMVESFLSGGRAGKSLGSTVGKFNIVWSGALVVSFVAMAPLVEPRPLEVVAGAGVVHLVSLLLLPFFRRDPGHHADYTPEPHPPVYADLLAVLRLQLPASYIVFSALSPYLPTAFAQLGIETKWHTPIAAIWLFTRTITFLILQLWHGWHGRWATPIIGGVLLLAGFAAAILAQPIFSPDVTAPSPETALPVLIAGLTVFGVGMGTIYAAALYYAMEVGSAKVDAGGVHEALIGVGFGGGPACGLIAAGLVTAQRLEPRHFEFGVLALVALLAGPVILYAVAKSTARRAGPRAR